MVASMSQAQTKKISVNTINNNNFSLVFSPTPCLCSKFALCALLSQTAIQMLKSDSSQKIFMKTRAMMRCKAKGNSTRKPVVAIHKTSCLDQALSWHT